MKTRLLDFGEKLIMTKNILGNLGETQRGTRPKALGSVITREDSNINFKNSLKLPPSQNQTGLIPFTEEVGMVPYVPSTNVQVQSTTSNITSKKKKIIDFSTFDKHNYLRDNDFLYCRRVGNPVEYIECVYSELMPKDKKKKLKSKNSTEYITMSKNTVMHYSKRQLLYLLSW